MVNNRGRKKNAALVCAIARAGMTQGEIAKKLGVSPAVLSMVVNRRNRLSEDQAEGLAKLLGVQRRRLGAIT